MRIGNSAVIHASSFVLPLNIVYFLDRQEEW